MTATMVTYKVKTELVAENEAALTKLFEAIAEANPSGVHYTSCKQTDGASFVAIVWLDEGLERNPLLELPAFQEFQTGVMSRVDGAPVQQELAVIGSYRFFE